MNEGRILNSSVNTSVRTPTQFENVEKDINSALEELKSVIENLENRLTGILRLENVKGQSPDTAPVQATVPIVTLLCQHGYSIQCCISKLKSISDRIEL
jgi:hypothetical protein